MGGTLFCLVTFQAMDMKTVSSYRPELEELWVLPPPVIEKLASAGIRTPAHLLALTAGEEGIEVLAQTLAVSAGEVARWREVAALVHLQGIGIRNARLLTAAGVETVVDLARQDPAVLYQRMAAAVQALGSERLATLPREAQVRVWVRAAQKETSNIR